ncbi:MAG TPA: hypothetical protein HA254_06865 [Candidatus Diapherotrites archaeon]|uniref:Uncharacterized protein n=1 Tax=Candidatus Iainarchaeum sp. TaxID=3101447 RepID=A0A7J4J562_9ARCH|nr:hypothetical protein [Candidatus Diapherotrites archaeon]
MGEAEIWPTIMHKWLNGTTDCHRECPRCRLNIPVYHTIARTLSETKLDGAKIELVDLGHRIFRETGQTPWLGTIKADLLRGGNSLIFTTKNLHIGYKLISRLGRWETAQNPNILMPHYENRLGEEMQKNKRKSKRD